MHWPPAHDRLERASPLKSRAPCAWIVLITSASWRHAAAHQDLGARSSLVYLAQRASNPPIRHHDDPIVTSPGLTGGTHIRQHARSRLPRRSDARSWKGCPRIIVRMKKASVAVRTVWLISSSGGLNGEARAGPGRTGQEGAERSRAGSIGHISRRSTSPTPRRIRAVDSGGKRRPAELISVFVDRPPRSEATSTTAIPTRSVPVLHEHDACYPEGPTNGERSGRPRSHTDTNRLARFISPQTWDAAPGSGVYGRAGGGGMN
jgi:hypothetical protein